MENKCVIIIDETLATGRIANASVILAMSLGKEHPSIVGQDLVNASGNSHSGITTEAIPVLKGGEKLNQLREKARDLEGLTVIDVNSGTSCTRSYEEYAKKLATLEEKDIEYYGVGLYGPKKLVNKLTGSLGVLR